MYLVWDMTHCLYRKYTQRICMYIVDIENNFSVIDWHQNADLLF